jgi:Ca-activated chloride channel homolog
VTFAAPLFYWLAALAPLALAILFAADEARRRALIGRLGEAPAVGRMMASASPGRRRLKAVLVALAMVLVLLAAARPQMAGGRTVRRSALDVVIAIDASTSMLVRDVAGQTRLARARAEAEALLGQLAGDRVSIVLYAGAAVHFPLTEDHDVAAEFASQIGPADLPGGSDLGEALRVARCLLRSDVYDDLGCRGLGGRGTGGEPLPEERGTAAPEDPVVEIEEGERGKAVLVLADGGDSRGHARQEVERARDLGIAVFFAGVGSTDGGRVPEIDSDGRPLGERRDDSGKPVTSALDEDALRALAAVSGDPSRYLALEPAREPDPARLAAALRKVARGIRTQSGAERPQDVYPVFLFPAFLLLVIEACIGTRRRVRYPETEVEVSA